MNGVNKEIMVEIRRQGQMYEERRRRN